MELKSFISDKVYNDSKIPQYFREFSLGILVILVGIDFIFMGLHALKSLGYIHDPAFSITKNWGYGETFQYLKAAFLTGCFLWLAFNYKHVQLFCWAFIFLYVLLDDSLEIHEHLGYHAGQQLDNAAIPGGNTLGELLVFAILGLIIFIPLFVSFFRSHHRNLKIMSQDLLMLFVIMLIFGVGVDVLHDMAETGTVLNGVLGLVEDGGEMVAMSAMVWYVWTFIRNDNFLEREKNKKEAEKTPYGRNELKNRPAVSKSRNKDQTRKKKTLNFKHSVIRTRILTPAPAERGSIYIHFINPFQKLNRLGNNLLTTGFLKKHSNIIGRPALYLKLKPVKSTNAACLPTTTYYYGSFWINAFYRRLLPLAWLKVPP